MNVRIPPAMPAPGDSRPAHELLDPLVNGTAGNDGRSCVAAVIEHEPKPMVQVGSNLRVPAIQIVLVIVGGDEAGVESPIRIPGIQLCGWRRWALLSRSEERRVGKECRSRW